MSTTLTRLTLAIVVVAAAAERSSYDTSLDDAEAYLAAMGMPAGLPLLEVKYKEGGFGRKRTIGGADTHLSTLGTVALGDQPFVQWQGSKAGNGVQDRFAVMMIDPDAPSRASADGLTPGKEGPVLHWFALNCAENTGKNDDKCYHLRSYRGPQPADGTGEHRYIFILFQQIRPPPGDIITTYLLGNSRNNFDLAGFIRAVDGALEPRAINFFYGSSEREPEQLAGPSTPAASGPRVVSKGGSTPPPPAPLNAEGPSRSLGPRWETTPPDHDEL